MKVKFLKDHLEHKTGDVIEVDDDRANYWQNVGVAVPEKKEKPSTKEKNEKAGPNDPKKK